MADCDKVSHICEDHCMLLLQHLSTHVCISYQTAWMLFKDQLERSKAKRAFNMKLSSCLKIYLHWGFQNSGIQFLRWQNNFIILTCHHSSGWCHRCWFLCGCILKTFSYTETIFKFPTALAWGLKQNAWIIFTFTSSFNRKTRSNWSHVSSTFAELLWRPFM